MFREAPPPPVPGGMNALLGSGSVFEGKLSFEGQVRIDGSFTGAIATNDLLVIGESAKVSAEISCGSVLVKGEVSGNITATESVELQKPARVRADIATPSLAIEKGVFFDGNSKMASGLQLPLGGHNSGKRRTRPQESERR